MIETLMWRMAAMLKRALALDAAFMLMAAPVSATFALFLLSKGGALDGPGLLGLSLLIYLFALPLIAIFGSCLATLLAWSGRFGPRGLRWAGLGLALAFCVMCGPGVWPPQSLLFFVFAVEGWVGGGIFWKAWEAGGRPIVFRWK